MRFRALLAALMICACTKVQDKVRTVRVVVSVSNVPPGTDHLDVTLTDSSKAPQDSHPLTDGGVLTLGYPAPQNGRVDVHVAVPGQQLQTTASGIYADPNELDLTARIGFAVSCDGGPCAAPLSCHRYANEPGVCTHACASAGECESTLPAASCGTDAGMSQWSCTDGGVCPVGLTCVIADGGKFCSGI